VLFGDIWERPQLSKRDRSLITCAALVAMGKTDHLAITENLNGKVVDWMEKVSDEQPGAPPSTTR
jgi:alkylhydroperoxidase/carboxymuconolactone decarboxylase family protein YurZ